MPAGLSGLRADRDGGWSRHREEVRMSRLKPVVVDVPTDPLAVGSVNVALDRVCDACKGVGVTQSEAWARWLRRFEHEERRLQNQSPPLERMAIVDGAM